MHFTVLSQHSKILILCTCMQAELCNSILAEWNLYISFDVCGCSAWSTMDTCLVVITSWKKNCSKHDANSVWRNRECPSLPQTYFLHLNVFKNSLCFLSSIFTLSLCVSVSHIGKGCKWREQQVKWRELRLITQFSDNYHVGSVYRPSQSCCFTGFKFADVSLHISYFGGLWNSDFFMQYSAITLLGLSIFVMKQLFFSTQLPRILCSLTSR